MSARTDNKNCHNRRQTIDISSNSNIMLNFNLKLIDIKWMCLTGHIPRFEAYNLGLPTFVLERQHHMCEIISYFFKHTETNGYCRSTQIFRITSSTIN